MVVAAAYAARRTFAALHQRHYPSAELLHAGDKVVKRQHDAAYAGNLGDLVEQRATEA
jgi:hypothetical protein